MRILLIHQAFVSPQEPGGTRHYEFARHLVRAGHQVVIVASDLSYLTGRRTAAKARLFSEEVCDGIRVIRAYTYPALHKNFVWRVVSFLSFMMTSLLAALKAGPVDLVLGTSPPIFQVGSAWAVSALRRRPLVFEVRDLWPEFAIDMGVLKSQALIRLSRWLEAFLYSRSKHIIVNSPAYRDYLVNKGVSPRKVSLIPNSVAPEMFDPIAKGERLRKEWELNGSFIVSYTGALGLANDIPTILQAAERLKDRHDICFLLVGDGKERGNLERFAEARKLENVRFLGSRPKYEIPNILAASDACVASLQNIPMFRTTYPNKVFDYMAAARPTILAIDGVIREVVENSQGGIFVPPGNETALAEAVISLASDRATAEAMGKAARKYVEKHFKRRDQARAFADLLYRINVKRGEGSVYRRGGKRALDLFLSVSALIILAPVLVLLGLLAGVKLGRPVLFRQQRPGLYGKPFRVYKFRSMNEARDEKGDLLSDEKRLTHFGRILRSTSLDELPELLNVVKGDMSLVGPRPLLMQYLERYTEEQARRHEVKPGVTGWAQVNGRNAISWEQKFEHDVWYVDNMSFWLDLKIIALTIWKILKREGISHEGQATMEEFMGTHAKAPADKLAAAKNAEEQKR
jgi:lipopolysaccharide/colanic/teichoic acid biosynthesis glycosyltransferase